MSLAAVKITEWNGHQVCLLPEELENDIKKGDMVIVKAEQDFEEIARVMDISNVEGAKGYHQRSSKITTDEASLSLKDSAREAEAAAAHGTETVDFILRKASSSDLDKLNKINEKKLEYLKYCRECAKNLNLDMKLVDCHISFDEKKIVFAFTAEGRIDFRELVKMLNWSFRKSIRMHQIGIRDEAKISGHLGMCGRSLCCKRFLKEIASVNSEAADAQQINHRGAERISGICGRLMCCLNYEKEGYKELAKRLPPLGARVKFDGKELKVVGWHVLKQTVDLEIDKDTKVEAEINKLRY
ncbi:hypothetical protein A2Y83_05280 [Candidatus Falkowbacteria bacterium RBG_13_39_14]|uniref:PSP1 C-terminal domain-containing protein n=1 Tax=Candidatus Falkowbacteria bacterium RBG_13_39_14 TaxID=1797985 RepID=A0A1F5S4Y5_9BACT|nr:MAG: hypothetical protein A2Y83_05280 [Candidatus Falkowbacteria bacterium RBG_13_39_14]